MAPRKRSAAYAIGLALLLSWFWWSTPAASHADAGAAAAITVGVAGDICDPEPSSCEPVADLVQFHQPAFLGTLGDHQYEVGALDEFRQSYDLSWGRFVDRTMPAIGNHEVKSGTDNGYCSYFGAAARCPSHQYRVDLGPWSWIVLDTSGPFTASKRAQFKELLSAAGSDNTAVAFHHAPYSSPCDGCHRERNLDGLLRIALNRGVDVIVFAHDHKYESFRRMGVDGPLPDGGIPMFLSGAGGAHPDGGCTSRRPGSFFCAGTGAPSNDVEAAGFEGILFLSLELERFSFEFVQADGTADGLVIDSGRWATR